MHLCLKTTDLENYLYPLAQGKRSSTLFSLSTLEPRLLPLHTSLSYTHTHTGLFPRESFACVLALPGMPLWAPFPW